MFASVGCFIDRMIKMRLKKDVCVSVTQITRTTVTSENLLLISLIVNEGTPLNAEFSAEFSNLLIS